MNNPEFLLCVSMVCYGFLIMFSLFVFALWMYYGSKLRLEDGPSEICNSLRNICAYTFISSLTILFLMCGTAFLNEYVVGIISVITWGVGATLYATVKLLKITGWFSVIF